MINTSNNEKHSEKASCLRGPVGGITLDPYNTKTRKTPHLYDVPGEKVTLLYGWAW